MDRFNLEESIMSCWNTKDDIELLAETFSNKEMSEDEIINSIQAISNLHEMRCQKLMNTFEILIENNIISSKICE
jgi:hypothetical protein